jgi:hypothetical protein
VLGFWAGIGFLDYWAARDGLGFWAGLVWVMFVAWPGLDGLLAWFGLEWASRLGLSGLVLGWACGLRWGGYMGWVVLGVSAVPPFWAPREGVQFLHLLASGFIWDGLSFLAGRQSYASGLALVGLMILPGQV